MRSKSIFIAIIISLFIFQSAWNVAAAFCAHENTATSSAHFGHHELLVSCQTDHATESHLHGEANNHPAENGLNLQDHHDHLPSFSHGLVIDSYTEVKEPRLFNIDSRPRFAWSNLYQSPDLGALTPPPLSTPL